MAGVESEECGRDPGGHAAQVMMGTAEHVHHFESCMYSEFCCACGCRKIDECHVKCFECFS
jgi:hypothetical protein